MTPELKAAMGRLRKAWGNRTRVSPVKPSYQDDCELLASLALAEHPADDDEQPSMAELEELFRDPLFPPVERDGKRFAFVQAYVEIQTRVQLRRLVKALEGR